MNKAELQAHPNRENFPLSQFRVADILLKRHSAEQYELFVPHHYFTGTCLRFRLSSTTLMQQGAAVSVSSAWRTMFDAEPCIPPIPGIRGEVAGGRMVTDGPDHLLVAIGDHGYGSRSQASNSHLGKLVRVEIETGQPETPTHLERFIANPQAFAPGTSKSSLNITPAEARAIADFIEGD